MTQRWEVRKYFEQLLARKRWPKACVIWPHGRNTSGYAQIKIGGRERNVSRMLCEERHGKSTKQAAHTCGHGADGCVNMNHLIWQTQIENMAGPRDIDRMPRGPAHHNAKLTAKQVRFIRKSRLPTKVLRAKFRLRSCQTVRNVQLGATYRTVA